MLAESFERIHRSNLIGMGVMPCEFIGDETRVSLKLTGEEQITIKGLCNINQTNSLFNMCIQYKDGTKINTKVKSRLDTKVEIEYFKHGGILPFVLRRAF